MTERNATRDKQNGEAMKPKTALKTFALKTFSLKACGMTLEIRQPRAMTAQNYEARYRAEVKALRREYCTLFAFWKSCGFRPCRKARACAGDAHACLKRNEALVSREKQFAARQRLLDATPANIGAPERLARQTMPGGLYG
jgi:hypothetical protein